MSVDTIEVEDRGAVSVVSIRNPKAKNALSRHAIRAIAEAVQAASERGSTRAVVLTGSGGTFSAGAALTPGGLASAEDEDTLPPILDDVAAAITAITTCSVPVIAAVEGAAAGVGASLAIASDLLVAGEGAYFLLPFGRIGLMPDGAVMRTAVAALGRARTLDLALRQQRLPAEEARSAGLVATTVADGTALDTALEWAAEFSGSSRVALAHTKEWVNRAALPELDEWLRDESHAQAALMRGDDHVEGVAAFFEKRPPRY